MAYRRVYDSRHLQADYQEPGAVPGPCDSVFEYGLPLPFLLTSANNGIRPHRMHCVAAAYRYRYRASVIGLVGTPARCVKTAEPILSPNGLDPTKIGVQRRKEQFWTVATGPSAKLLLTHVVFFILRPGIKIVRWPLLNFSVGYGTNFDYLAKLKHRSHRTN